MTWTPPKPEPCGPDCTCRTDAHPTGNAAQSIGDHDRRQRELDTELDQLRPCTCATSDTPAQHHCGPSAQLPPRREDTERARDWPAYQTGRAPVSNPTANVNQQLRQTPEEFRQTAEAAKALGDQIPPQKRRPWAFWKRLNTNRSSK